MKAFYAAILSGGNGSRFGGERPKQFAKIAGVSILRRSLLAFERHPQIAGIVLVANPGYLAESRAEAASVTKLLAVVPGGATRTDSTQAALDALPEEGFVLLHDAARPLLSQALIARVIDALPEKRAVSVAVPVRDTLYRVDAEGNLLAIPERAEFRAAQTPQAFELSLLREALKKNQGRAATDDAAIILRAGGAVFVIPGEEGNFKITTQEDLGRIQNP